MPKASASVDNDKLRLDNSSYHVKTEFNNCFIIYLKEKKNYRLYDIFEKAIHVLFHIPAPLEADVVLIGMTS